MFAVRGAISVDENSAQAIEKAGADVVLAILERNRLTPSRIISALFTVTPDLDAAFPATGARHAGFAAVPMVCAQEIPVPGAPARIVRVLLHVEGKPEVPILHVYLGGAAVLRPDLLGPGFTGTPGEKDSSQ